MRGQKAKSPLVIYIAETDHGDMSYASLSRQVIEDCASKGLSAKVFSEFESQTYKVNGMTHASKGDKEKATDGAPADIDEQLRVLRNAPSRETHIATTEFLDRHLIAMGGVKKRWRELVPQNWEALPEEVKKGTPENLLRHFEDLGAIDNPAILQMMRSDVREGKFPREEEGIEDANINPKSYYDYWGGCLNYKLIHEEWAQDVKRGLAGTTPDVLIMIAGKAHIQGLNQQFDQQFPEFADSQKIVIRNSADVVIDGVGQAIEFEFDKEKREAQVPALLKKILSPSEELSREPSWVERVCSNTTRGKSLDGGASHG
jgi:hypothetical protein